MTPIKFARHLAALRPRNLETHADSLRHALRSQVRIWQHLNSEAKELRESTEALVPRIAPQPLEQFGIGVETAVKIQILAGDNPDRIHSEAALAKLAGVSPVPTGSRMTSGWHCINHGGQRQLNAANYRKALVRMRFHEPTIAYVNHRAAEGRSKLDIIPCLKR